MRPRSSSRPCGPGENELATKLDALWKAGKPQSEILIPLTECKVDAAEVANKVAGIALTVTGGYGYRRRPIGRSYRDARAAIAMGPSNIIARDWIGKSLVGIPLELFYEGASKLFRPGQRWNTFSIFRAFKP